MKRIILTLTLTALSSSAFADFRSELDISESKTSMDYEEVPTANFEAKSRIYRFTYYLDKVNTENKPYRLASFLNHSSWLLAELAHNKPSKPAGLDTQKTERFGGDVAITDTNFRGTLLYTSIKSGPAENNEQFIVGGGWYANPNGLLSANVVTISGKSGGDNLTGNAFNLAYLQALSMGDSYLTFSGSYQGGKIEIAPLNTTEELKYLRGAIRYYPTQELSMGIEFSRDESDYENFDPFIKRQNHAYRFGIGYDLSEGFGISVDYGSGAGTRTLNMAPDTINSDTRYAEVNLSLRF